MARNESDREDLMAEAVALVRRIEVTLPHAPTPIISGFRANGWFSIYFGQDRMYQFDEQGRLRRAFVEGLLFRTQGTTLAQLHRQRTNTETTLVRRDLSSCELSEFQMEMHDHLTTFRAQYAQNRLTVVRQFPDEDPRLISDLVARLDLILFSFEFLAPPISGKP